MMDARILRILEDCGSAEQIDIGRSDSRVLRFEDSFLKIAPLGKLERAAEETADGVIRISFSPETTETEINEAIGILNEVGKNLQQRMK